MQRDTTIIILTVMIICLPFSLADAIYNGGWSFFFLALNIYAVLYWYFKLRNLNKEQ